MFLRADAALGQENEEVVNKIRISFIPLIARVHFLINPLLILLLFSSLFPGWLGALSTAIALLISPVTVALCKRKSTRITAVIGGLVTALGCLFTSFASQFHQLFFSYGEDEAEKSGIHSDIF